jgi:hypothetical protein
MRLIVARTPASAVPIIDAVTVPSLPSVPSRSGRAASAAGVLAAVLLVAACAPVHDWREWRSADGSVQLLFPCRPQLHERRVALAGSSVKLSLLACESGGLTWGLASTDLGDPTRLGTAIDELAAAAAANLAAKPHATPLRVPGATPHPGSRRLAIDGRRPDGQPAQMQLVLFTHGTKLYQASVLGPRLPTEPVDTYLDALRVPP